MISIQNNLLAMNADRHLRMNSGKNAKTTEKLSSGYRINRAADDAAGLAISEKMRRQIRGLMQATANARDGVSYVQTADGAMEEVHNVLQRMSELSLKSLNDTLSESDRAALNAELDQLRTEIDRINQDTEFNEQSVFEEHEPSYYQLVGNRRWNDNQEHTVSDAANDLNIHLPAGYSPSEYTLTVPPGVYTTQELIDEIDDALTEMSPANPGFVFEYTDKGFCKLNFESAKGLPTEISSVDGGLSYLLYDNYGGSSTVSLLGTTLFDATLPLYITSGKNDELGFYIEGKNSSDFVSMKIPAGAYNRSQMISLINENLSKNPAAAGVAAKEFGASGIQITGGDDISITGLKGNMFKLETTRPIYSSVFYDNVNYGDSTGGSYASIVGNAYYYSTQTAKFDITDANNTLRFRVNGNPDYTEIELSNKEYTIFELISEINTKLVDQGIEAKADYTSSYYLTFSSTIRGSESQLFFDTTPGSVYANTYETLFLTTKYLPRMSAGQNASLMGYADMSRGVSIDNRESFSFNIDNNTYTISNIGGDYKNNSQLVTKLNDYIQSAPAFAAIKDKIKFGTYGNGIAINAQNNEIQKIYFTGANKNATYQKLFVGENTTVNYGAYASQSGTVERPQGSTQPVIKPATASMTVPKDQLSKSFTIDNSCNQISLSVQGRTKTVTLNNGTYTMERLFAEIKSKIENSSDSDLKTVGVDFNSSTGKILFTSTPPLSTADGSWSIGIPWSTYESVSGNYAWKEILGTTTSSVLPYEREASQAFLATYDAIAEKNTIHSGNNELTVDTGDGPVTIHIAPAAYNSRDALKTALQQAIDSSALKDKVKADITSDGKLKLTPAGSKLNVSGSFYKDIILSKRTAAKPQSYTYTGAYTEKDYTPAYIIGRKDLTAEPVEIVAGANDTLTFDFTHKSGMTDSNSYELQMDITIPEGVYNGNELAAVLQKKIQDKFDEKGLKDFDIKASIGGFSTGVVGSNDDTALQIVVNRKAGREPDKGEYILDGIRGSAASFIFYKTTDTPKETYIAGTKNITNGISFKPGQNTLTLFADSTPYQYTFPENTAYTAEEFVRLLNDMFTNGDDNGNTAPLEASIENGALKIAHQVVGSHTITDIGGSARNTLFFEEGGRDSRDPMTILVSAEAGDTIEIPRVRVSSCALKINSITISRPKYAEKAVKRIKEAINLVSSRRSVYGAIQNRLEHTINNNNNVIENTQASESLIRDTDVAGKVMENAVNHILMQTSQAMLAQANQMGQVAVRLLG